MDKNDRRAISTIEDYIISTGREPERSYKETWELILKDKHTEREGLISSIPMVRLRVIQRLIEKEKGIAQDSIGDEECDKYELITDECLLPSCSKEGTRREIVLGDPDLIITSLCDEHYEEIIEEERVRTLEEYIEEENAEVP